MFKMFKRGQVTAFIILAIVIVVGILVFFVFRGSFFEAEISAEFSPIYNSYSECIKQETENALSLLGTGGGRIEFENFVSGNDYSPFSSHLMFLGIPVPYWYYLSGNNLIKENIPTIGDMERDIEEFLENRVNDCDLGTFYEQGFFIEIGNSNADVNILEDRVVVNLNSRIVSSKEERSALKTEHEVEVESKIGGFYKTALEIYNKEKDEAFIEDYAVDVLYNYAPVDGVEVQCSPKIWKTPEIVEELKQGLEDNIRAIKLKGDYYSLDDRSDDYFVVDSEKINYAVNFIYLGDDFPSKIEVTPASQTLMVAEPVGNQQGLGVIGFCYVPYHFVYDVAFPVLIQITDGNEIFQFPFTVIIDNNLPREANLGDVFARGETPDLCSFNEGNVNINVFDVELNPVEAEVSYRCFDNVCDLGKTEVIGSDSVLETDIPLCVNGELIVEAEGYVEKRQLFSSNSESFAEVILDREHEVEVELKLNGKIVKDTAVVHFVGSDLSVSAVFPENTKMILKEDLYDIEVYVYGNSKIVIPSTEKRECFDTVKSGLLGLFGGKEEKCVKIQIPELKIDSALIGGGKTTEFILEDDLRNDKIVIEISELPKPESIEQLQYNYEVFDSLGVRLSFE
jgi:hypothetical protein